MLVHLANRLLVVALLCSFFLSAGDARAAGKALAPQKIVVGVYVSSISRVSLRDNRFRADFYVWFRWTGEGKSDPLKTFEVVNGTISRSGEVHEDHETFHYASCRVAAEVTQFFEVSRFPLDAQTLRIEIEDSEKEADFVEYVPDQANSGLAPDIEVPGWKILSTSTSVIKNHYATNYGVIDLPSGRKGADYSRFVLEVPLAREGVGHFLMLFFVLFIAFGVNMLAHWIRPDQVDPRFGLPVGAIFAAIGSLYITSDRLPDTNVLTLSDRLHMLLFAVIFLTLAESTLSLWLWNCDRQGLARRIDRLAFWTLGGLFVAGTALALIIH